MQPNLPLAGRPSIVPSELKAIIHRKKNVKEVGVRELFSSFFRERYSGHGLRRLVSADSLTKKTFWMLIFLVFLALGICHSAGVMIEFFDRNKASQVKITTSEKVVFPAVTICSQNPLDLEAALKVHDEGNVGGDKIVQAGNVHTLNEISEKLSKPEDICSNGDLSEEEKSLVSPTDIEDITDSKRWFSSKEDMVELFGFSFAELVHACTFNTGQCTGSHFYTSVNYKYGLCYTFNSNLTGSDPIETVRYGSQNGLKLVLKQSLRAKEHLAYPKQGFRVSIHSPNEEPHPEEAGFDVGAGQEVTSVGVKIKHFHRLAEDSSSSDEGYVSCVHQCHSEIIKSKCQCSLSPGDTNACDTANADHRTCLDREEPKLMDSSLCTSCKGPAMDTVYETSILSGKRYRDIQMLEMARRLRSDECEADPFNFEEFGLFDVNVYLETLTTETHQELYKSTIASILTHIGGMLALFLGVSLVVFLEIIELIIDFCILCCCKGGNKVDPDDDVESEEVMIRYQGFPFAFSNMVAGQAKRASIMSENIMKNIESTNEKTDKGFY